MSQPCRHRFGDFVLDSANRSLLRDGVPVALNARYFDALALLVREHGRLVGKQRFFDEVWAGSVVTDAALTQAIKEVRRLLGDDAADPRFVRTVPGHGYCFIATVVEEGAAASEGAGASSDVPGLEMTAQVDERRDAAIESPMPAALSRALVEVAAATAGGGLAGLAGGLLYGSALAFAPGSQGLGSLSVLLVLLALCMLVGMAGALGVGAGLAGGRRIGGGAGWTLAGGALGGLCVGGISKLLGSDAFTLLVGQAPAGITGGLEGATIGFAVAAGLRLGGGWAARDARRPALFAAATTALAGALIPLAGGSGMATSLARVAAAFDGSRLDMTPLGRLFGEPQFSTLTQATLGAVEGGIFGACVVGALVGVRRTSA